MGLQLVDGEFLREDAPDSLNFIVLNEAAVKMLELKPPYAGQTVIYKNVEATITGVVRNFIYGMPSRVIDPLVLTTMNAGASTLYIRFDPKVSRSKAREIVSDVLHRFDSEFIINPFWAEDEYNAKFSNVEMQFRVALIGSLLSVFIAMIGLLATHLYTARRRTKEIGIRRINGATVENIFSLLSWDVLKWIVVAGALAAPVSWYIAYGWLDNYGKHASLGVAVFLLPLLVQCLIALAVTSGVSISASLRNPVNSLKSE
jgi:putative ABC transport system permease protein